jgi:acetyltransferase-like isoleucine patch superfamily enzyme
MEKPLGEPEKQTYIHETAIVEPGAIIGTGVTIWHHSHVRSGAAIGEGSKLGKNVYVDGGASIGRNCSIQNNVSIYRGVTLSDSVFVGPSAVFTNDLYPRAGNESWPLVPTVIGEGASIGANATIICGITIGSWAMIGAGSVVSKDVESDELAVGNPAHQVGWVCVCGQILERGLDTFLSGTCGACGRAVRRNP